MRIKISVPCTIMNPFHEQFIKTLSMTTASHIRNVLLGSLFCLFITSTAHADLVDKVVAVVNEDIITLTDLEKEASQFEERVRSQVPEDQQEEAMQQMRDDVLDQIIENRLIAQEAAKINVTIPDEDFNRAYQNLLDKNGVTREQFAEELNKSGISVAYHKQMFREQMLRSKVVSYQVRSKIVVTENMIEDYYKNEYTEEITDDGYYLQQIGVSIQGGLAEQALEQIERVRNLALSGASFPELAEKFSDLPSAADGGDIGVFAADEMSEKMRHAITSAPPNGITEIIETDSGYQFFKVTAQQKGNVLTKVPYDVVKDEIRDTLFEQQFQQEYSKWMRELRRQSYIKIL